MAGPSSVGWWGQWASRWFGGTSPEDNKEVATYQGVIKKFEDLYGIKVQIKDNEVLILPAEAMPANIDKLGQYSNGFGDYWVKSAYVSPNEMYIIEQERRARYLAYAFMDANSPIATMTLDTFADEIIAATTLDEEPIVVNISDKGLEKKIMQTLYDNEILSSSTRPTYERSEIRDLAKFGDRFYKLAQPSKNEDVRITKIRCPELVSIIWDPKNPSRTLEYAAGPNGQDRYYPWEFSHMAIPDSRFMPYGRSILEPMRAAYQQLLINETLMAISRSSKVDRLVMRVPVPQKNAIAAFSQIQQMRKALKIAVFGDSGTASSRSKIDAYTDIAMLPSGDDYDMERMSSTIAISDIEDVEYFRDLYIMGSRLPKGYLLADGTFKLDAGTLQAQDVKFSRALMPLQYGYVEGLTRLIVQLIILYGGDPTKVKVEVSVKKPQAFSAQVVADAMQAITFVDTLIRAYGTGIGADGQDVKKDREKVKSLYKKMSGLPERIIDELDEVYGDISKAVPTPPPEGGINAQEPGTANRNRQSAPSMKQVYRDMLGPEGRISCTGERIVAQMAGTKEALTSLIVEVNTRNTSMMRHGTKFEKEEEEYFEENRKRMKAEVLHEGSRQ